MVWALRKRALEGRLRLRELAHFGERACELHFETDSLALVLDGREALLEEARELGVEVPLRIKLREAREDIGMRRVDLGTLLERCLSRDLGQRFASAADLADALVEFAPGYRRYAERARRLLATPSVRASRV